MKSQIAGRVAILFLVAVVGCKVKEATSSPPQCQCESISDRLCQNHFNTQEWYGQFPNARGQDLDQAATEFYHFSYLLVSLNNYCSHMLFNVLCFHYFPFCVENRPDISARPCRETCNEALSACAEHLEALGYHSPFQFPTHLNCNNFPPRSSNCVPVGTSDTMSTSSSSSHTCSTKCFIACPDPLIHVEFVGTRMTVLEGSEHNRSLEICLRLANVGSYSSTDTLDKNVSITITPHKLGDGPGYAQPGLDFLNSSVNIIFEVGCPKRAVICAQIPIFCDDIREGNEIFGVRAEVETGALFGGDFNSTQGSIIATIIDRDFPAKTPSSTPSLAVDIQTYSPIPSPTSSLVRIPTSIPALSHTPTQSTLSSVVDASPTLSLTSSSVVEIPASSPITNPAPSLLEPPTSECIPNCRWRRRVTGKTLTSNQYTFAALIRRVECYNSVMVVNVTRCVDINCGKCPKRIPTVLHIPICHSCITTACSVTGDVLIAGKDVNNQLYIPNYKIGGVFALPLSSITDWEETVSECTQRRFIILYTTNSLICSACHAQS